MSHQEILMGVIMKLTFPAGRYHATPWGRHVNEGVAEWPPSPWRLLRALVATWKRKCSEKGEDEVRRLLERLVHPPAFQLPPSRVAHTRHYVPWEKTGPLARTLVLDTFVVLDRKSALYIGWTGVELAAPERGTLEDLARNLTTLGRAESWVEAELVDAMPGGWNCVPAASGEGELVSVMCADPASAFASEHYPVIAAKKRKKGLAAEDHLFDCPRWHLCLDTETIHTERWSRVPGARWVSYARVGESIRGVPAELPDKGARGDRPRPTVARFAVDGPVLPSIRETVSVADAFRSELLRCHGRWIRRRYDLPADAKVATHPILRSRTFSGREEGGMIVGSNDHAYFLPTDEDDDGRIDHVTVVAGGGLNEDEVAALDGHRRMGLGEGELRLSLVGLGVPDDFRCLLFERARVWESWTPFVVTRHLKLRGQKRDPQVWRGIEGQGLFALHLVREELERWWRQRQGDEAMGQVEIELLAGVRMRGRGYVRALEFRRARAGKGYDDGYRRATGAFRLELEEAVRGPINLGHGAHYGLGMFRPWEEGSGR